MKSKFTLLILLISFFSFSTICYSQKKPKAYVKFAEQPPKKINKDNISSIDFFIEFKTKKQATIYLALKKGDKLYSNAVATVKSKKPKKIKLNLSGSFNKIIAGKGHQYELFMFEGPRDTWNNQLGTTTTIDDIRITRM